MAYQVLLKAKRKPRTGENGAFAVLQGTMDGGHPTDGGNIRAPNVGSRLICSRARRKIFWGRAPTSPTLGLSMVKPQRGGNEGNGGSLALMARLLLLYEASKSFGNSGSLATLKAALTEPAKPT